MSTQSSMLKAKVIDGHIIVESNNCYFHAPTLVACSEPTSRTSGSRGPSLVIFPELEEGQEGLLVMRHPKESSTTFEATWPLRISLKDGKPWLSLKDDEGLWFCTSDDRIGGVVDSHLEVQLDGKWYTTEGTLTPGKGYIPDTDLVCRYLVGKAEKEELLEATQQYRVRYIWGPHKPLNIHHVVSVEEGRRVARTLHQLTSHLKFECGVSAIEYPTWLEPASLPIDDDPFASPRDGVIVI